MLKNKVKLYTPELSVLAMELNSLPAVWIGKALINLSRLQGKGGSSLPGRVALSLDKRFLSRMAARLPLGTVAVSGTNGKTTTATMLASIFRAVGYTVAHNRAGANLMSGLTSALIASSEWSGQVNADVGLFEVDEATMPLAGPELLPKTAIVTNFFRDQLDRYGELETTVAMVAKGLAHLALNGTAALNADDPYVASLGDTVPEALYYGLEDEALGLEEMRQTAESKHCRRCGHPHEYQLYYYAHLGKYHCPQCGLSRPQPKVYVDKVLTQDESGSLIHLVTPMGGREIRLQVPGLYNIYNALAATAGAVAMGISLEAIQTGLEDTSPSFGRMERLNIRERQVTLALVKNPVGFNEVIRTILAGKNEYKYLMICINDLYFDGTDISWLWDVDFEQLGDQQDNIPVIVCSGLRAEDMALRLKYAGIDVSKLRIENDLKQALELALEQVGEGELLHILPTYTAMLSMREILHKQGLVQAFWKV